MVPSMKIMLSQKCRCHDVDEGRRVAVLLMILLFHRSIRSMTQNFVVEEEVQKMIHQRTAMPADHAMLSAQN